LTEKKIIYFDESGYTGTDLLNLDQPVFCVASSDLEEELSREILSNSFPRFQGNEFKFRNIWRNRTHRGNLSRFIEALGPHLEHVFGYAADKEFVLLTKIVDFLVEPVVTQAGYDFYANGFCRGFANMFHFAMTEFASQEDYATLINAYGTFSKTPTVEKLAALQSTLENLLNQCSEELKPFLGMASFGAQIFHDHSNIETFGDSNEIQLTVVLSSVAYWRSKTDLDLVVIHDQSSNFFKQKDLWDTITAAEVPEQVIISGSGFPVQYPLRVVSTEPGDSRDHWTIQLCDMVSGLMAKSLSRNLSGDDSASIGELMEAGLGELQLDGIRPGTDFIEGPPSHKDGPDAVDQFTQIIFRQ